MMPPYQTSSQQDRQQQQQQQQQRRHGLSSDRTSGDGSSSDVISPDTRLAIAAPAAAADSTATTNSSGTNAVSSYQRLVKRYRVEVAASASSVLSTLTTFPLDSVKTRMQTYRYAGFRDCVQHTYQTEKLRGFFRGKMKQDSRDATGHIG
jgi:hypothetical protein